MALEIGSRLGHYEVTALIGEGGMGQVYQATDTKLNRQVALKILPEAFAADPDRLARFQREAQVLASLNHPGIAAIYGLEESEDTRALVLELVEGPTLADRIRQGPIPLDEALPIAKQIAEALEAAHEAGVIRRDLKPANIKVRDDGTVKVLDFGLAKALDTAPEGDPSLSPTLTAAATQMGVIMGTAAYMSPEQARGKPVDRRADVWAFGAVLFEMLTGKRPFEGEDVSLTLSAVLQREPDWSTLPEDMPPALRTYLVRCLEKDPRQRIRDIGDVRLAMEGVFETTVSTAAEPTVVHGRRPWQRPAAAAAVGLLAMSIWGLAVWSFTRPTAPLRPLTRFTVAVRPGLQPGAVRLSSDGVTLGGSALNRTSVYVRPWDELDAVPLRGGVGMIQFRRRFS
jgi:serine/threonine-protein kinase